MPVEECTENGKPGFKWGSRGKCYTYNPNKKGAAARARVKAELQGRAAHAGGYKGGS